jgi:hypothetical protein
MNNFGQSYVIKDEYETGDWLILETNLGTFCHRTDLEDNEWLDDSLTFTTREDFLNNNWQEME